MTAKARRHTRVIVPGLCRVARTVASRGVVCVATIDGLLLVSCIKVRRVGAGTAGRDDPALLGLPSLPGRGQKPCPDRVPEGAAGRLDPKTICSVVWRAVTRLVATAWVGRDRVGPALRRRGVDAGAIKWVTSPGGVPS